MSNIATCKKRMEKDVTKLIMSDYKVKLKNENSMNEFSVSFKGPEDSFYEFGIWKVNVLLPDQYPYKSPSIGFLNKIYHPNIDEASGSVCLDVINQTWSPMYDLKNIFDIFLPQLLKYPNEKDPLNSAAAKLFTLDEKKYEETVKEYVKKYASEKEELKEIEIKEEISVKQSRKLSMISSRKPSYKKNEEDDEIIQGTKLDEPINEKDELSEISEASIDLIDDDFSF